MCTHAYILIHMYMYLYNVYVLIQCICTYTMYMYLYNVYVLIHMYMYLYKFIFSILAFCLFYGADALLRERAYEFLGILVAVVLVMLYVTVNFIYHMVYIGQGKEEEFSPEELAARVVSNREVLL